MNFYIVFLLPSVFGLKLFMNFNKEKNKFDLVIYYLLFVLFSNLATMFLLMLFNKGGIDLVNTITSSYIFSIKYIATCIVFNILLSILFTIIIKYFKISIEVEHEKKSKIKKSNKNK